MVRNEYVPDDSVTLPVAVSDQLLCGRNAYAAGGRYHIRSSRGNSLGTLSGENRTVHSIRGSKRP